MADLQRIGWNQARIGWDEPQRIFGIGWLISLISADARLACTEIGEDQPTDL